MWHRHLLNCAVVASVPEPASTVCDLGSGAGLPGIVWAILRPDVEITLLEPSLRRTRFLNDVVARLDLRNVEVIRGRAEDQPGAAGYDVVTARAVAALDRLARWALPLCRSDGEVLAFKGAGAANELARVEPVLRRLGVREWRIERYGEHLLERPTTVVRLRAGQRSP